MMNEDHPNTFAAMVDQAEAAVQAMKDPELRRVAFEKILETLLASGTSATTPRSKKNVSSKKVKAKKKTTGKTTSSRSTARDGPKARVAELVDDGYFGKQRTIADVKAELANRGYHIPTTSLSGPLQSLTRDRRLRREKRSSGGKGAKTTFVYSNW